MSAPLDSATEAIAAQLVIPSNRMAAVLGEDLGTDSEEVEVGCIHDPLTGHTVVGIAIDALTYSLANGELICHRERGGRVEWAKVTEDGEPDRWRTIAPPPGTATMNQNLRSLNDQDPPKRVPSRRLGGSAPGRVLRGSNRGP